MGQEILYCSNCQTRLLGSDFEKGKAFRIGDRAACASCAKDMLAGLSPQERENILASSSKDPRKTSSPRLAALPAPAALPRETPRRGTRLPAVLPPETPSRGSRALTESSTRIKTTVRRAAPKSRAWVYAATGAAILTALAAIIAASMTRATRPSSGPTAPPARYVPPPRGPGSPPAPASDRESAARRLLREALEFASKNPADSAGRIERLRRAASEAKDTPLEADARKELEAALKKIAETFAAELAAIEERARAACGREEFKQAIDLLGQSRSKYNAADWTDRVDAAIGKIRDEAHKLQARLKEEARLAKRAGAPDRAAAIRERVARWGLPALVEDFDRALADEPRSIIPPIAPAALLAYRKRWEEALAPLAVRDYGGALRALKAAEPPPGEKEARDEHERDVEILRLASLVLGDALHALSRWPKGRSVRLAYVSGNGARLEAEGTLISADDKQVEIGTEAGAVAVPVPEIAAASIADIFKGRAGADPAADGRAAAAFLLLEGDIEAAKGALGDASALPEKYWNRARRLAEETASPEAGGKEAAARALFWTAEDKFRHVASRAEAIEKHLALLGEHADTAFVRRNRALIASRHEAAREWFFRPEDLPAGGTFAAARCDKVPSCLTSTANSPPERGKDNYAEIVFYALPETQYRCWVYAGACCAETFTFYAQVTDLAVPNPANPRDTIPAGPGDNASVLVRNPLLFLKKTHAMHGGPKTPERWAWFEVSLPKFPSPGVKKVRILTDQAGFSVAYAVVSSSRKAPPADQETKEIIRAHTAASSSTAPMRAGPVFYRAINLNGPPTAIDGRQWEGKDAPNYSFSKDAFENQGVELNPSTDPSRARMIRSSIWNTDGTLVRLTAVPNGTYHVYLYVWEDNHSQTFDILVNGKVVRQRYSSGAAGHWERLGPWTAEVVDNTIEVRATRGDANFSGIEIWRVR